MHPVSESNCIWQHHEQITRVLNAKLQTLEGVRLTRAFCLANGSIVGAFRLSEAKEESWSFSAANQPLKNLEREINLDLLASFFNDGVTCGSLKTEHLFTIIKTQYIHPTTLHLHVATEGLYKKSTIISINLEAPQSRVYNFATGRLNLKKIDELITATLNGSRQDIPRDPSTNLLLNLIAGIKLRTFKASYNREMEEGIPFNFSKRARPNRSYTAPQVRFSERVQRHFSAVDLGPALARADVSSHLVAQVIEELVMQCRPTYSSLVSEARQKLDENPDFYKEKSIPSKKILDGLVRIPRNSLSSIQLDEERYYAEFDYTIERMDKTSALGMLVDQMHKQLDNLSFPSTIAEIRFEKGCFDSVAPEWHTDGSEIATAITTCFGTKPKWTTWVLDDNDTIKIFGTLFNIPKQETLAEDQASLQKMQARAQPTKFGYLYNAKALMHRAPKIEDLGDDPIRPSDFRLFIRFLKCH